MINRILLSFMALSLLNPPEVRAQAVQKMAVRSTAQRTLAKTVVAQPKTKGNESRKDLSHLELAKGLIKTGYPAAALFPILRVIKNGSEHERRKALQYLSTIPNYLLDSDIHAYLEKLYGAEIKLDSHVMWQVDRLLEQQKYSEARLLLERSSDSAWHLSKVQRLAETYLGENNSAAALSLLQEEVTRIADLPLRHFEIGTLNLMMGQVLYQLQRYKQSADAYRDVTKSHPLWSQALSQLAWAEFMQGKLRSALSPLITIQSPHYDNYLDPEGLYLRGLIYLFACQYQEIDLVIENFQNKYLAASVAMQDWINAPLDLQQRGELVMLGGAENLSIKKGDEKKWNHPLPFYVVKSTLLQKSADREISRIREIEKEIKKISANKNIPKVKGSLLVFLKGRREKALQRLGAILLSEATQALNLIRKTQVHFDFLRVEALDGKRQEMQKKIAGEGGEQSENEREAFSQNGYRYWPFQGEYWKDELGQFFYLGKNSCEK